MIFQDAVASLNPGRSIGETIAEPLRVIGKIGRKARFGRARELMRQVGLNPDRDFVKLPHEFYGGQCQRISIARSLIMNPKLLVCDEPVSSLDVSVQAQVLNLLERMKAHYNFTLLFISQDLAVVKNISDRVAKMYLGKLSEIADSEDLYRSPRHPYTAALLASIPNPHSGRVPSNPTRPGVDIPSPANPPSGCRFHTRCPRAHNRCIHTQPDLKEVIPGLQVACHYPL